jgi:mono/diheme cytochrome c family protein
MHTVEHRRECVIMRRYWVVILALVVGLLGGLLGVFPPPAVIMGQEKPPKLNPFTGDAEAIKEGDKLYVLHGCSGCHGRGGGGGMGIPIIDDVWKYGGDDATLMKLIKGEIAESPMPKFGQTLSEEQIWKIVAYIRSIYHGDPAQIVW